MINLLQYRDRLKVQKIDDVAYIYDPIRKKNIILQPEEMVRQLTIIHLIEGLNFNSNFIQVEKRVNLNGLKKRFDIIVYDKTIKPYLIVECKAPHIRINQSTFDQVSQYNYVLDAPFIMVTNGKTTKYASVITKDQRYDFIDHLLPPD